MRKLNRKRQRKQQQDYVHVVTHNSDENWNQYSNDRRSRLDQLLIQI